ncbi:MAG: hypothetical protein M1818_008209 [Claussenomyces sp. TS43310]|nr:MAG: hypothetical protein M1818_008209 [Claussenomyces sp. TS43310]
MDFIEGRTLEKARPDMSTEEKRDISRQSREVLIAMRSIESKTGIIGSCSGGMVRDCRRFSDYTGGPFTDLGSFNDFILDLVKLTPKAIRDALTQ